MRDMRDRRSAEQALAESQAQFRRMTDEIPVSQVIIAHKAVDGTIENFSTVMRDIRERKRQKRIFERASSGSDAPLKMRLSRL